MSSNNPKIQSRNDYTIDPDHTTVAFSVNHLGFSNISGRFPDVTGNITLDQDNLNASTVSININTVSINSAHPKRDQHLSGEDFFDVAHFSQISFESSKFEMTGDKQALLTGNITILGVTKQIILDVIFNQQGTNPFLPENYVVGFSVKGQLMRSDFGMKFGLPMIGDTVDLTIEVEAIRQ